MCVCVCVCVCVCMCDILYSGVKLSQLYCHFSQNLMPDDIYFGIHLWFIGTQVSQQDHEDDVQTSKILSSFTASGR